MAPSPDPELVESYMKMTAVLPEWRPVIETLLSRPGYEQYVGPKAVERGVIPEPSLVFHSLQLIKPENCQVVIFGQDPYPRKESACGIAFDDKKITTWDKPLCPSLRNIIKNVLMCYKLLDLSASVDMIRTKLKEAKVAQPDDWFHELTKKGVLLINTSLTYKSEDELEMHLNFWKPIVQTIIKTLLSAHTPDDGVVFVLWGRKAESLMPMVKGVNASLGTSTFTSGKDAGDKKRVGCIDIKPATKTLFVKSKHPAVDAFHEKNSFRMILKAQVRLGQKPINFLHPDRDVPEDILSTVSKK